MASMITENFHSFGEPPPSSRPLALCHLTLEPKVCNETITGPNMCNRTYIWRICGRPSRVTSSQTDSILAFPTPPLEGRLAPRVAPATGAPFRVHRKRFGQTGMPESEALSLANCQTTGQLGCLHHYTQIYNIYIILHLIQCSLTRTNIRKTWCPDRAEIIEKIKKNQK